MADGYPDAPPSEIMPLSGGYRKVGWISFIALAIIGFVLPVFLAAILGLLGLIVFVALFIISYLKIRDAKTPNAFVYLFILTAPSMINTIFSLFVPTFGAVAGFIGIFLSYFILSGKELL